MTESLRYPVTLLKQKRTHIQISCTPDFTILVKAPFWASKRLISDFLVSKQEWIEQTMSLYKQNQAMVFPNPIVYGSSFYYLGTAYNIVLMTTQKQLLYFENDSFVVCLKDVFNQTLLRRSLINWYKDMALDLFLKRLDFWKEKMNVRVNKVIVKQFKARWGSCSIQKNISLNWILIKAPIDIIDYVIVHECCHLVYFNHSKQFWELVKQFIPDYKQKKQWLKQYGVFLLQNH